MDDSHLRGVAHELGLSTTPEHWASLAELRRLWRHYGRSMNLTGDTSDIALNTQIAESFLVVALATRLIPGTRWLDIGSGSGFPALVVGILLDVEIACVEPREKRAAFLDLALHRLGVRGRVHHGRVAGGVWVGSDSPPIPANIATARAVWPPHLWLAEAKPWVVPAGVIVAHQRPQDQDLGPLLARADSSDGRWSARAYANTPNLVPRGT